LLRAFDDELAFLALSALETLSIPPLNHRCDLDVTRHSTSLHKNTTYFQPLFEIVECSCCPLSCGSMSVKNFLSNDFVPSAEVRGIKIDSNSRLKYCKLGSAAAFEEVIYLVFNIFSVIMT